MSAPFFLFSFAICVVLPVAIVYLWLRNRANEVDKRSELIMAAIEKYGAQEASRVIAAICSQSDRRHRKLVAWLCRGVVFCFLGIGLFVYGFYMKTTLVGAAHDFQFWLFFALVFFFPGLAMVLTYFVARALLAPKKGGDGDSPNQSNVQE